MKAALRAALFFAALMLLWALCTGALSTFGADVYLWSPYVLPAPDRVAAYLWENSLNGTLPSALLITLQRLLIGYGIGLLAGVPLGMFCARFRAAEDTLGLLALGLQALPSVCWVPLACIWFGQSEAALLFVVIMGTLWSVLLSTANGMKNVPPIYARAAQTMGCSRFRTLVFVTLPASAPYVVSGAKQGWAFAWRSLMAAELYVSVVTGFGIGGHLHYGRELQRMDQVIGIMLIIIIVGLLADKILFSPAESLIHRRWGTNRS